MLLYNCEWFLRWFTSIKCKTAIYEMSCGKSTMVSDVAWFDGVRQWWSTSIASSEFGPFEHCNLCDLARYLRYILFANIPSLIKQWLLDTLLVRVHVHARIQQCSDWVCALYADVKGRLLSLWSWNKPWPNWIVIVGESMYSVKSVVVLLGRACICKWTCVPRPPSLLDRACKS